RRLDHRPGPGRRPRRRTDRVRGTAGRPRGGAEHADRRASGGLRQLAATRLDDSLTRRPSTSSDADAHRFRQPFEGDPMTTKAGKPTKAVSAEGTVLTTLPAA